VEIKQIFKNNENWIAEKLETDKNFFNKLSKGQKPDFLYIGCSDSRVAAEEFMGLKPGQAFIHRNIANMVSSTDLNMSSVLEYAVNHLKVKHIIVCGHYGCGGVKASMESSDMGALNPWLENIKNVSRTHKKVLSRLKDKDKRERRLVELNTQEQCLNLFKMVTVQKAIKKRNLKIHGWVFDLHNGQLKDLKIDVKKIVADTDGIFHLNP